MVERKKIQKIEDLISKSIDTLYYNGPLKEVYKEIISYHNNIEDIKRIKDFFEQKKDNIATLYLKEEDVFIALFSNDKKREIIEKEILNEKSKDLSYLDEKYEKIKNSIKFKSDLFVLLNYFNVKDESIIKEYDKKIIDTTTYSKIKEKIKNKKINEIRKIIDSYFEKTDTKDKIKQVFSSNGLKDYRMKKKDIEGFMKKVGEYSKTNKETRELIKNMVNNYKSGNYIYISQKEKEDLENILINVLDVSMKKVLDLKKDKIIIDKDILTTKEKKLFKLYLQYRTLNAVVLGEEYLKKKIVKKIPKEYKLNKI